MEFHSITYNFIFWAHSEHGGPVFLPTFNKKQQRHCEFFRNLCTIFPDPEPEQMNSPPPSQKKRAGVFYRSHQLFTLFAGTSLTCGEIHERSPDGAKLPANPRCASFQARTGGFHQPTLPQKGKKWMDVECSEVLYFLSRKLVHSRLARRARSPRKSS